MKRKIGTKGDGVIRRLRPTVENPNTKTIAAGYRITQPSAGK